MCKEGAMTDLKKVAEILKGKVRGKPAAISLFYDEIPESYQGKKIDPCGIVRAAMDLDEIVYVDRTYQDCVSGAFTGGFHQGTDISRTGEYIAKNIPAYTRIAAARIKSGENVLPQGMVKGIGAAPLDEVPEGVKVDWICVVCNPYWANFIGAARTVKDGTAPRSSCGISFCADLFASPWHDNNVVVTPGDIGGRMNNKLKPEELFVVIPAEWLDSMVEILETTPDAKAIYESIKPDDSDYWVKKKAKQEKESAKKAARKKVSDDTGTPETSAASASKPNSAETKVTKIAEPSAQKSTGFFGGIKNKAMKGSMKLMTKIQGSGEDISDEDLGLSMDWDAESITLIRKAPKGIVPMAIHNVEEFAEEHGHARITRAVIVAQMEDSGMDVSLLEG